MENWACLDVSGFIRNYGLPCLCHPERSEGSQEGHPKHGGIVLAAQVSWTLSSLIAALDRLLSETEADEWIGQVRWMNEWRASKHEHI